MYRRMEKKSLLKFLSSRFQTFHLEKQENGSPRFGHGLPAHPILYTTINANREMYASTLRDLLHISDSIQQIKDEKDEIDNTQPVWNSRFVKGLDIVALYGFISKYKPSKYVEIAGGNYTKVARKAILDSKLSTKITTIDFSRNDQIQSAINDLHENDILFIDNSESNFSNSNATICFLEILPYLKKGVLVHFSSIYLPSDYPQSMSNRYCSEQSLLGTLLMANPKRYKTILPNYFISEDKELSAIIAPMWSHENTKNVEGNGVSFWVQIG